MTLNWNCDWYIVYLINYYKDTLNKWYTFIAVVQLNVLSGNYSDTCQKHFVALEHSAFDDHTRMSTIIYEIANQCYLSA